MFSFPGASNVFGDSSSARYAYDPVGSVVNDEYQNRTNQDQRAKGLRNRSDRSLDIASGVMRRQNQLAHEFSLHKDKYKGLIEEQNVKPLRLQMSQKLADTKLDASRRGLLNSGVHKRKSADIISQYKSDYGSAMDNARNQFMNFEADVMEAPINTGFELGGLAGNAQENYYRAALSDMQARNMALSGLGQGIGSAAGTYLANRRG